jgi:hypothetical protein
MDKDHLEKRFGVIAVEQGFIEAEQLIEAIKIQAREDIEKKQHRPIGRILLALGHITVKEIDKVLEILWKKAVKEKGLIQDLSYESDK